MDTTIQLFTKQQSIQKLRMDMVDFASPRGSQVVRVHSGLQRCQVILRFVAF